MVGQGEGPSPRGIVPGLHRARYFAATDALGLISGSGELGEARGLAMQRARLTGRCSVFRLDRAGIVHVETVYGDGTGQLPLFALGIR